MLDGQNEIDHLYEDSAANPSAIKVAADPPRAESDVDAWALRFGVRGERFVDNLEGLSTRASVAPAEKKIDYYRATTSAWQRT